MSQSEERLCLCFGLVNFLPMKLVQEADGKCVLERSFFDY